MQRRVRFVADETAVARARIGTALYQLRRAGEAQIVQEYAVKLAGLSLCLRSAEIPAAAARLKIERETALERLRELTRASERELIEQAIGIIRGGRSRDPPTASPTKRSRAFEEGKFRQSAREVAERWRRTPRRPVRAPVRRWQTAPNKPK
jgi:hypothetical protein